jgi:DNA polymerase elongation subunit (family B)
MATPPEETIHADHVYVVPPISRNERLMSNVFEELRERVPLSEMKPAIDFSTGVSGISPPLILPRKKYKGALVWPDEPGIQETPEETETEKLDFSALYSSALPPSFHMARILEDAQSHAESSTQTEQQKPPQDGHSEYDFSGLYPSIIQRDDILLTEEAAKKRHQKACYEAAERVADAWKEVQLSEEAQVTLPQFIQDLIKKRQEIKSSLPKDYRPPSKAQERRNRNRITKNSQYGKTGSEPRVNICTYCWTPNPPKRCKGCHMAFYCDEECQKEDWKESHRSRCRK